MQYITRKFEFDAGHRVMNERMKCFNAHGHRYTGELTFSFDSMKAIGYTIDFKEIKRVGCAWIDDMMDHGFILNPCDYVLESCLVDIGTKIWRMSLNGSEYCNPTAENIVREIFVAQEILFEDYEGLKIHHIRLYETPNCWTDCYQGSIPHDARINFRRMHYSKIRAYAKEKGILEYDDREVK